MSDSCSSQRPESLYDLTLRQLCRSMNEEALKYVLQWYPPQMVFQVVWKVLCLSDAAEEYTYSNIVLDPQNLRRSLQHGHEMAQVLSRLPQSKLFTVEISDETLEVIARAQQIQFFDELNFCRHFNLDLFFKLIEVTECRNQLFTLFQICIQKRSFKFPEQFANEWIARTLEVDVPDNETHFHNIEQGLKLGIFLGDSGWLSESAHVLSYTHSIITKLWVSSDQNLKLIKTIQCLTKWLIVASNCYHFDAAKNVLHQLKKTITILENIENRTLCIAYAYVAVSQYYYLLMEFNEAWAWTVKAVHELHDKSGDVLKLLVISHTIRICSVLNKLDIGKKLINQLHKYDKKIDHNIHVELLLNEAFYSLKADLANDSVSRYYFALDSWRNLFGYYNLHTATVFVEYAYARYVCEYSSLDFNEAMCSILQAIFIMKKIGLPDDNLLVISAGRIKALILEEKALDMLQKAQNALPPDSPVLKAPNACSTALNMFSNAEYLQSKGLHVSLKALGEKTLLTAKSYSNLGRLYQSQEKFTQSEKMQLKAIEIKESILGKDHPEVALSLGHLASLYLYQLKKYKEAEQLYLRSKKIYETTYGLQYTGLLYDLQGLLTVYKELNNIEMCLEYEDKIRMYYETRNAWLIDIHTLVEKKCIKDDLSVDKLKCIIDECDCNTQSVISCTAL